MNFPERELEVLKQWEQDEILRRRLASQRTVCFYGDLLQPLIRIHHVGAGVQVVFRDFITMQIYRVVGRWLTHGLPVELRLARVYRKAQIEEYGIAKFNEKCKESVWTYKDWRLPNGLYWVDLEKPFITYDTSYVESLWGL